ncbi:MAG: sigma-54 dependent transcriptional regulator [Deltaproteobacteria bacterium]|nr:sigma-54 dependent transcriptional regulator [Deltaproteobacteria bacterium]
MVWKKMIISLGPQKTALGRTLKKMMLRQGVEVLESSGVGDFIESLGCHNPNLAMVIACSEDGSDGMHAIRAIRQREQGIPIILVASSSSEAMAIEALRSGATDYLKVPVKPEDLKESLRRTLGSHFSGSTAEPASGRPDPDEELIIGNSAPIVELTNSLRKIAATDCTVLITGETGTGKELVARLVHRWSPRSEKPCVTINCAAIPDTLLESEVFGYERGAFTGAYSSREGAIKAANRGTLFFDEIGEMSPYAQAKILRTIENKEVTPVGGRKNLPVNVRFIAATNQDLEQLMKEGKFRSDLYFRLNVARIHLPPLRERKGDIVLLLNYFRKRFNRKFGKKIEGFSEEAIAALIEYDWPGNVRELKNLLEAAFIHAQDQIGLEDLPNFFQGQGDNRENLSQEERSLLLAALSHNNWNKSKAAEQLRWSRMTLYRKLKKYRIDHQSSCCL